MRISDSDFLVQVSVKRMVNFLRTRAVAKGRDIEVSPPSTERIFLLYLKQYCEEIAEQLPDQIIKSRNIDWKSEDITVKTRHEQMANKFITHLSKNGKSSNTVATALAAVREFYATSFVALSDKAMIVPSGQAETEVWLPEPQDLFRLVKKASLRTGAYICCAKDTGIGVGDLVQVKWSTPSAQYGTVKEQLKRGEWPIHIHFVREKTRVVFDTYFGSDATEKLNEYADFSRDRIFPVCKNQIRADLKVVDRRLRPHTFRKFFTTYVKMSLANELSGRGMFDSAGVTEVWVEYWSGHSLGKVKKAYNIPPVKMQMDVYRAVYPRIKLKKA